MTQIIHLSLQYAPEALHRGIVQTLAGAGHTLTNLFLFQSFAKGMAGILRTPVTMNQRSVIITLQKCPLKGIQNQSGIIFPAHRKRNDVPPIYIQNGTQVRFAAIPILEFSDIRQPFFIRSASSKLPVQSIFSNIISRCFLFVPVLFSSAHRTQAKNTHQAVNPFEITLDAMPPL